MQETDDEKIKITWYFPSTNQGANFFSDIHTFTLRYTVRGAMRIYPGGDQFWWKFVEATGLPDRVFPRPAPSARRLSLPTSLKATDLYQQFRIRRRVHCRSGRKRLHLDHRICRRSFPAHNGMGNPRPIPSHHHRCTGRMAAVG